MNLTVPTLITCLTPSHYATCPTPDQHTWPYTKLTFEDMAMNSATSDKNVVNICSMQGLGYRSATRLLVSDHEAVMCEYRDNRWDPHWGSQSFSI